MPKTNPNQLVITINKPRCDYDFLQISNQDWKLACRTLTGSGFQLYLYLASNCDKFSLALSKEHVCQETGMSESSYKRAKSDLVNNGYLVQTCGNGYQFYTRPDGFKMNTRKNAEVQNEYTDGVKMNTRKVQNEYTVGSKMNREIDNIDTIDNIERDDQLIKRENNPRPQTKEEFDALW